MNQKMLVQQLKKTDTVVCNEPLNLMEIEDLLSSRKLVFPSSHIDLLCVADGLLCFGGYFRMFGLSQKERINLLSWNSVDLWKFAWGNKLDSFFCFGETAFGDQYAYHLNDDGLIDGSDIYFIEGLTMKPEIIYKSFDEFLAGELFRNCVNPYDQLIISARNKLGDLSISDHISYVPSPLISDEENIDKVQKMDAIVSMIIGGDLCIQLEKLPGDKTVKELRPYIDGKGNNRMMIVVECR